MSRPVAGLVAMDDQGRVLLRSDGPVTLRYLHSVARTPVEEDFVAAPDGVRVTETRFASSGAGLPSQPEWGGTFEARADDHFAIQNMHGTLREVTFRIGHVSEQTLLMHGAALRLDTLLAPGSRMRLISEVAPRFTWWSL